MAHKNVVRVKKPRTKNKHLPTKTKGGSRLAKVEIPVSEEVGIITTASFGDPIETPNPSWIHRMKALYPNGVKHFMRVLLAHGFYTFDDACSDYHENPEAFRMFFKSTGLETETENTLEVLQLKLVQGFKKVETDLIQHGLN